MKLVTGQPWGLNASMTLLIVPSLPAASMPWSTTRIERFAFRPEAVLEVGHPAQLRREREGRGLLVPAVGLAVVLPRQPDSRAGTHPEGFAQVDPLGHGLDPPGMASRGSDV